MTDSTSDLTYKYVIIGAGNSAGYAARQFVRNGVDPGALCLIGDESVLPYERPALSKAFLMKASVRLPGFHTCVGSGGDRQAPDWYETNGIATILGAKVVSFDAPAKRAVLQDGRALIASEAVIVATGASPIRLTRTPGHELEGIHYLRNNADGLALFDALQSAVGKDVIVIGGGYIGMEVTAAAVTVGCNVTMVFPESHMMSRLFTSEMAAPYEKFYASKGVKFVNGGALGKEFLADAAGVKVRGVLVGREGKPDEEVIGSVVVVGVGARPETALLKPHADLDPQGGVVVDSSLRTSVDGVYAIGDIATFPLKMYGDRPSRVEHVQNCRDTAAHAVNAIVKSDTSPYDYLPYFYSRVFTFSWQFFGDNVGNCLLVSEMEADTPQMVAIWADEAGVLQGIFMEGPSEDDTANMKKLARERPKVDLDAFRACTTVSGAWAVIL